MVEVFISVEVPSFVEPTISSKLFPNPESRKHREGKRYAAKTNVNIGDHASNIFHTLIGVDRRQGKTATT